MNRCAVCLVTLCLANLLHADEPKATKVEFQHYDKGYFEKNTSGLKGEFSLLAITTREKFDSVFGFGRVIGKLPPLLPTEQDAFAKSLVVGVITRGTAVTTYKVEQVTADGNTLMVTYSSTTPKGGGTAMYASPMIIAVPRGTYTSVVFVENGKTLGKIAVGKE